MVSKYFQDKNSATMPYYEPLYSFSVTQGLIWNALPNQVKESTDLKGFKSLLKHEKGPIVNAICVMF